MFLTPHLVTQSPLRSTWGCWGRLGLRCRDGFHSRPCCPSRAPQVGLLQQAAIEVRRLHQSSAYRVMAGQLEPSVVATLAQGVLGTHGQVLLHKVLTWTALAPMQQEALHSGGPLIYNRFGGVAPRV